MIDVFGKSERYDDPQQARAAGIYPYFKALESGPAPETTVDGRRMIMLAANDYLGLASDPRVIAAARTALERFGTACASSRFLAGTLVLHEEFEHTLATFLGKEAALIFPTGMHACMGVTSTMVGRHDVVVVDRLSHASIIDGCRLSGGSLQRFAHNDMSDLDRVLAGCPTEAGRLVVVEGVYSMEGDSAPLPTCITIARKHGTRLMLDDAHGIGVLGPHGAGTADFFGCLADIDLIVGTFSKALASIGGFIAGPACVLDYIKHHARPMIFSAALPASNVAAAAQALAIAQEEPWRRARVSALADTMRKGLASLGYDTGHSHTPIIPVKIRGRARAGHLRRLLFDAGVFVAVVVPPAVPAGTAILRLSLSALHTEDHLCRALDAFSAAGHAIGMDSA